MYLNIQTDLIINNVYKIQTEEGEKIAKLVNFGVSRFQNSQNAISVNFETEIGEFFNISDISKIDNV
ncbi:MAG: hypothetical protein RLZZ414_247 [Bacteroidota bacterium]